MASLEKLSSVLEQKQTENEHVVKLARTCVQDAVPITFGQEIGAWNSFVKRQIVDIQRISEKCLELPLGATAVGTMINTPPDYLNLVFTALSKVAELPVSPVSNFFDALQFSDEFFELGSHQGNLLKKH